MNHIALIAQYGYFILLPLIAIEGPIAMFLAGFLVSLDYFDPVPAFLVAVAGTVLGDAAHYAIGYWGGNRLADRWGRHFGLTTERLAKLEAQFANRGPRLLLVSKIAFGISSIILIAAGVARYSFAKFNIWNTVGAIPKAILFLVLGYNFGTAYHTLNRALRDSSLIILLVALVFILVYWLSRKYRTAIMAWIRG